MITQIGPTERSSVRSGFANRGTVCVLAGGWGGTRTFILLGEVRVGREAYDLVFGGCFRGDSVD